MHLSVVNICDLVIAFWLIFAVLHGAFVGLVLKVGQIVAMIAAYIMAQVVSVSIGSYFGLTFLVSYIVLSVVFRQVVKVLNLVDKIPVLGFINHFGGAVCSFMVSFILIYLIVTFVFMGIPQNILDGWGLTQEAVQHSVLLGAFCNGV